MLKFVGESVRGGHLKAPRVWWFAAAVALLLLVYSTQLFALFHFAAGSDLYSHILLVPFVSGYLIWRQGAIALESNSAPAVAFVPFVAGVALLAAHWSGAYPGTDAAPEWRLGTAVISLLFLVFAAAIQFLGWANFKRYRFAALFLFFMVPFPPLALDRIESFLQHGSAYFAHALFFLSSTPVLRDNTFFQLPGIRLYVAPECSGIHSTLVLFIVSIVAGHLFLRNGFSKIVFTLFILPLALARNGLRIFVIGQLCVHYGPEMFESYIHRKGGPLFFVLSLIPLLFLLFLLHKVERRARLAVKGRDNKESRSMVCTQEGQG